MMSQGAALIVREYVSALVSPWSNPPVKPGWGCLVPTTTTVGYVRGSVTANADGSIMFVAVGDCSAMLRVYTAGANVAGAPGTTLAATNLAQIQAMYGNARITALGLRAIPNIAMTAVPGQGYSGIAPELNYTLNSTLTPTDLSNMPNAQMCLGAAGCSVTGRPSDITAFGFGIGPVTGYAVGTNPSFSPVFIVFTGLPAGAIVNVEAVVHIEGIPLIAHSAMGTPGAELPRPTLARIYPSPESLYEEMRVSPITAQVSQPYNFNVGAVMSAAAGAAVAQALPGAAQYVRNVASNAAVNIGAGVLGMAFRALRRGRYNHDL